MINLYKASYLLVAIACVFFIACSSNPLVEDQDDDSLIAFESAVDIDDEDDDDIDEDDDDFGDEFDDEFDEDDEEEELDQFNGYNRTMTDFNDWFYVNIAHPVAYGYTYFMPKGGREAVGNFFDNLFFPARLVNNLFQLKVANAGEETLRFVINTTIGLFGLFDPAKAWFGLEPHKEDFGQTLGFYGVPAGPHIVLPFFGPSNLRDAFGRYTDWRIDRYARTDIYNFNVSDLSGLQLIILENINYISLNLGLYESIKRDAFDLYPFLRDSFEQMRIKQIGE